MPKFRKKPVVIEAVQWNNQKIVCPPGPEWFAEAEEKGVIRLSGQSLVIRTLEGDVTASPGDWIIQGVHGELYPCKPDIFAKTYEPIAEMPTAEGSGRLLHAVRDGGTDDKPAYRAVAASGVDPQELPLPPGWESVPRTTEEWEALGKKAGFSVAVHDTQEAATLAASRRNPAI